MLLWWLDIIKKDWDGYGAKYEAKFEIFSRIMLSGSKTSFSARLCAYFQILCSLLDSAKNSAGAESQNPGGTDLSIATNPVSSNLIGKLIFLNNLTFSGNSEVGYF